MPTAKLYNITRSHHRATRETLHKILAEAQSTDVDGVLVILTKTKGPPTVRMAGKLGRTERAITELTKLKIALAIDE